MPFNVAELGRGTNGAIYHLQSGANSGLIAVGDHGIVIDAGLDDDAGKKIKRTLEDKKLTLTALILTHGHADHFGGAAYLRRALPSFTVYAPALEAAFIENPAIEGIFLSAGAMPFDALLGKFTRAQACQVDHILAPVPITIEGQPLIIHDIAGHSPGQIAVQVEADGGPIVFSADAFLPLEALHKYPVPFTVHIATALKVFDWAETLALSGATFALGHGLHLSGEPVLSVIRGNRDQLHLVIETTRRFLAQSGPLDEAAVTQAVCKALGELLASPVAYYLARATLQAVLVWLCDQKQANWTSVEGRLVWQKS